MIKFNPLTGQFDISGSSDSSLTTAVDDLITLTGVPENSTDLGTFTGDIIPDDSTIKESLQSLETAIESLPDPMEYKGIWNALTNSPALTDGTGNNGDVYYVNVAGTQFTPNIVFEVGDKVVYNGATAKYEKWDMTDAVASVFGRNGVVTAQNNDYTASQITNVPSGNLSATDQQSVNNELQTDIDGRQPTITGAATTITSSNLTINKALTSNASGKVDISTTSSTELGYVAGVTSAIQTQLNNITSEAGAINSKVYYVSTTGNDANSGYTITKPFLTLGAALTAAGNLGNQICVFPGTYAGNYTISNQNVTISCSNHEIGAIVNFTGTLTVSNTASSVRIFGITADTINHTGAGSLYLNSCVVNTALTSSSSGYFESNSTDTQGPSLAGTISITGTGNKLFLTASKIGSMTINNAGAIVNISNDSIVFPIVLQAGSLGIDNSPVYSSSGTSNAITATGASSVLIMNNVTFLTPTNTAARISIGAGVLYSLRQVYLDRANSVFSGTNIPQTGYFDALDAANVTVTSLTASTALASDANKKLISSSTTSTELGYVSGVTSAIQTQLNTKPTKSAGDLNETSFSIANNQSSAANVTGFAFSLASVRSFNALVSIAIDATSDLFEEYELNGINRSSTWNMSQEAVGDSSGVSFSITSAGQIQYTSSNVSGFVSGTIKFRAITTIV